MKDGPFRRALKWVALQHFRLNIAGTRWWMRLRGHQPYLLAGNCGSCGACCESPSIQVGRLTWYLRSLRLPFLLWHRHVNGFVLKDREIGSRTFVFECTHFDRSTRRCDSYDSRPGMCRDYPRALLWGANPEMLPGCGYRPLACGSGRFLEALEREGLDEATLKKVKAKLHLE